ncbi:hypothetical protein BRADI_3g36095v3 [Brachypodium distachyon]|uniref:RNase H type-1 domain-containing protein n=1 Tax=Brachypodium distachyon TaxID=15368 RepID=A0A2K2D1F0_BRADI|nr:hypothetical protein BRADI_3g36095v3 [Brachypodium distachyon]
MARCIWALADKQLVEHMCVSTCPDAKERLFHLIDTTSHAEFTEILLTLWAIWSARRKAIHEAIYQSPATVHGLVQKLLSELQVPTPPQVRLRPSGPSAQPRWIPPPYGMIKINVDGGVAKNQNKGVDATVCRDEAGWYLGSSARVFNFITDPPTLEALACCEALALAKDLGVQNVCVASDAQAVIKGLFEGTRCSYSAILREVAVLSRDFQDVSFVYESRSSNLDAHNLVRACTMQGAKTGAYENKPSTFLSTSAYLYRGSAKLGICLV